MHSCVVKYVNMSVQWILLIISKKLLKRSLARNNIYICVYIVPAHLYKIQDHTFIIYSILLLKHLLFLYLEV